MNSFEYASARQSWDPQHCQSIFLLETHGRNSQKLMSPQDGLCVLFVSGL
ncbi:BnaC07g32330D [Brassica napus]|uniref:BnaC07g32330D protein n=1 Tax=Brassica napus TaxID=3708 RepID=A0A078GV97_BRANA|nr:BnaC07g32330D [Brassica napus]